MLWARQVVLVGFILTCLGHQGYNAKLWVFLTAHADSLALRLLRLFSRDVSEAVLGSQRSHVVVERGFRAKQALIQNCKHAKFSVTLNWF